MEKSDIFYLLYNYIKYNLIKKVDNNKITI